MADISRDDDPVVIVDLDAPAASAPAPEPGVVVIAEGEGPDGLPARAERQADGSIILPLAHPVTLRFRRAGGEEVREEHYEQLHLHRLTGKDMRAVTAASREAQVVVALARSARIPEPKMNPIYDLMDGADAGDAMAVVAYFLGSGRTTGR